MKPHALVIALTALSATAAAAQSAGDRYGFTRGGYVPTYSYGATSAAQQGQPAYGRVLTWANKDSNQSPDYDSQPPPYPQPRYASQPYPSQARTYAPQGQGYGPQYNAYSYPAQQQAPAYSAPYQRQSFSAQGPQYPAPPAPSYAPQYARSYAPAPRQSYDQMTVYGPYARGQASQIQQAPPLQRQGYAPAYAEPNAPASTQGQGYRQPMTYIPSPQARTAPQTQGYAPQYAPPSQAYGQGAPAYQPQAPYQSQAPYPQQAQRQAQPIYAQPQYAQPQFAPPHYEPQATQSSMPTAYMSSNAASTAYIPRDIPPMGSQAQAPARTYSDRGDAAADLQGGPPPQRQAAAEQYPAPSASSPVTRVPIGRAQSQPPPAAVRVANAQPPEQGQVHYYSLHRAFGLTPDTIPPPNPDSNMVLIGPSDNTSGSKDSSDKDDDNTSEKPF